MSHGIWLVIVVVAAVDPYISKITNNFLGANYFLSFFLQLLFFIAAVIAAVIVFIAAVIAAVIVGCCCCRSLHK